MTSFETSPWLTEDEKRAMDIRVALALNPIARPLVKAGAFAIRTFDHVDPYFDQQRVGFGLQSISIPKLRTLRGDIDEGMTPRGGRHSRETKVGGILRKLKIDEFRQFELLANGQLALVGPRPIVWPEYYATMRVLNNADRAKWKHSRMVTKPGLFSLYDMRSRLPGATGTYRQRAYDDIEYTETASIDLDLSILPRVIGKIARRGHEIDHMIDAPLDRAM